MIDHLIAMKINHWDGWVLVLPCPHKCHWIWQYSNSVLQPKSIFFMCFAVWSESLPLKHSTTWRLKPLIIWQQQVNNVTLPVPRAMEKVNCSWEMSHGNELKPVIIDHEQMDEPLFVGFSFATAVAHGSGYWPPRSSWSHPGMCRDHTRSVQTGPSDQQVDSQYPVNGAFS